MAVTVIYADSTFGGTESGNVTNPWSNIQAAFNDINTRNSGWNITSTDGYVIKARGDFDVDAYANDRLYLDNLIAKDPETVGANAGTCWIEPWAAADQTIGYSNSGVRIGKTSGGTGESLLVAANVGIRGLEVYNDTAGTQSVRILDDTTRYFNADLCLFEKSVDDYDDSVACERRYRRCIFEGADGYDLPTGDATNANVYMYHCTIPGRLLVNEANMHLYGCINSYTADNPHIVSPGHVYAYRTTFDAPDPAGAGDANWSDSLTTFGTGVDAVEFGVDSEADGWFHDAANIKYSLTGTGVTNTRLKGYGSTDAEGGLTVTALDDEGGLDVTDVTKDFFSAWVPPTEAHRGAYQKNTPTVRTVYVDEGLATGNDDGTDAANAYQSWGNLITAEKSDITLETGSNERLIIYNIGEANLASSFSLTTTDWTTDAISDNVLEIRAQVGDENKLVDQQGAWIHRASGVTTEVITIGVDVEFHNVQIENDSGTDYTYWGVEITDAPTVEFHGCRLSSVAMTGTGNKTVRVYDSVVQGFHHDNSTMTLTLDIAGAVINDRFDFGTNVTENLQLLSVSQDSATFTTNAINDAIALSCRFQKDLTGTELGYFSRFEDSKANVSFSGVYASDYKLNASQTDFEGMGSGALYATGALPDALLVMNINDPDGSGRDLHGLYRRPDIAPKEINTNYESRAIYGAASAAGSGKTISRYGVDAAYDDPVEWESDEQKTLDATTLKHFVYTIDGYDNGEGGGEPYVITGWGTNFTDGEIIIVAAYPGHETDVALVPDTRRTGAGWSWISTASFQFGLDNREVVHLYGMYFHCRNVSGITEYGLRASTSNASDQIIIERCRVDNYKANVFNQPMNWIVINSNCRGGVIDWTGGAGNNTDFKIIMVNSIFGRITSGDAAGNTLISVINSWSSENTNEPIGQLREGSGCDVNWICSGHDYNGNVYVEGGAGPHTITSNVINRYNNITDTTWYTDPDNGDYTPILGTDAIQNGVSTDFNIGNFVGHEHIRSHDAYGQLRNREFTDIGPIEAMPNVIRYIDDNSATGGDGQSNATVGVNRAYNDIDEWDAAEGANLVLNAERHVVYVTGDLPTGTSTPAVNNWTTSKDYNVNVRGHPSGRHLGIEGEGARITGTSGELNLNEDVSFFAIQLTKSSGIAAYMLDVDGTHVFENVTFSDSSGLGSLYRHPSFDENDLIMRNCIYKDSFIMTNNANTGEFYWINCTHGIDAGWFPQNDFANIWVINSVWTHTGTADLQMDTGSGTTTGYNNASEADYQAGTGWADVETGQNNTDNLDLSGAFVDTTDYKILSTATDLVGQGIGHDDANATLVPWYDIGLRLRSNTTCDIGAWEYTLGDDPVDDLVVIWGGGAFRVRKYPYI